ncbi:unnamed protein product [Closterium sp. NIES-53]
MTDVPRPLTPTWEDNLDCYLLSVSALEHSQHEQHHQLQHQSAQQQEQHSHERNFHETHRHEQHGPPLRKQQHHEEHPGDHQQSQQPQPQSQPQPPSLLHATSPLGSTMIEKAAPACDAPPKSSPQRTNPASSLGNTIVEEGILMESAASWPLSFHAAAMPTSCKDFDFSTAAILSCTSDALASWSDSFPAEAATEPKRVEPTSITVMGATGSHAPWSDAFPAATAHCKTLEFADTIMRDPSDFCPAAVPAVRAGGSETSAAATSSYTSGALASWSDSLLSPAMRAKALEPAGTADSSDPEQALLSAIYSDPTPDTPTHPKVLQPASGKQPRPLSRVPAAAFDKLMKPPVSLMQRNVLNRLEPTTSTELSREEKQGSTKPMNPAVSVTQRNVSKRLDPATTRLSGSAPKEDMNLEVAQDKTRCIASQGGMRLVEQSLRGGRSHGSRSSHDKSSCDRSSYTPTGDWLVDSFMRARTFAFSQPHFLPRSRAAAALVTTPATAAVPSGPAAASAPAAAVAATATRGAATSSAFGSCLSPWARATMLPLRASHGNSRGSPITAAGISGPDLKRYKTLGVAVTAASDPVLTRRNTTGVAATAASSPGLGRFKTPDIAAAATSDPVLTSQNTTGTDVAANTASGPGLGRFKTPDAAVAATSDPVLTRRKATGVAAARDPVTGRFKPLGVAAAGVASSDPVSKGHNSNGYEITSCFKRPRLSAAGAAGRSSMTSTFGMTGSRSGTTSRSGTPSRSDAPSTSMFSTSTFGVTGMFGSSGTRLV